MEGEPQPLSPEEIRAGIDIRRESRPVSEEPSLFEQAEQEAQKIASRSLVEAKLKETKDMLDRNEGDPAYLILFQSALERRLSELSTGQEPPAYSYKGRRAA